MEIGKDVKKKEFPDRSIVLSGDNIFFKSFSCPEPEDALNLWLFFNRCAGVVTK
jgi:hypothetical protein